MNSVARLDATFSALADPTRRGILARLSRGSATVMELVEPFDMTQPAVSKHIAVLRRAGLVSQEKDGRIRRCSLDAAPMKEAAQWIAEYRVFWEGQLDALSSYIEELENKERSK